MKMVQLAWLLSLLVITSATGSSVHQCCQNNASLQDKGLCSDNRTSLVGQICRGKLAYMLQPSLFPRENFTVLPTGDLIGAGGQLHVGKDEFCMAKYNKENIILVCYSDEMIARGNRGIGVAATVICSLVSSGCLLVTLAVYCLVEKLRDLQGKCIMCSIASLAGAFIFLATFQYSAGMQHDGTCLFMASMMYVLFLFVFFWLNIVSFNVWQSLTKPHWLRRITSSPHLWFYYCAWGWGVPLFLVFLTLILHYLPMNNHVPPGFAQAGINCWFNSSLQIWLYFYGPISLLLFLNLVMFAWCLVRIWYVGGAAANGQITPRNKRSRIHKLSLYLKLFVVMGICWTFEPISGALESYHVFWVVTDYINALQGVMILLLLVIFRRKARVGLVKRIPALGRCCHRGWITEDDVDNDSFESSGQDEPADLNHQTEDQIQATPLTNNQLL